MDTKSLSADIFDACKKSYAHLVEALQNKSDELVRLSEDMLDMRDAAVNLFWQSARAHWQEEVRKHPDLKLDTQEHEVLGVLVEKADKSMRMSARLQEFEKELPNSRNERKDLIYCAVMFQDHSPIEGTILEQWKHDESFLGFYNYEILKTFTCSEIEKPMTFSVTWLSGAGSWSERTCITHRLIIHFGDIDYHYLVKIVDVWTRTICYKAKHYLK